MNNQYSGSRVGNPTQPYPLQYVSQYDSNGYLTPNNNREKMQTFAQSQAVREGYHINPQVVNGSPSFYGSSALQAVGGTSRVKSETNRFVSSQVKNEDIVKGESRVSYVPYQKKVIQYQDRTYVEKVPVKRKVVTYQQRRVMETVPREVIKQDYYAVQKRVEYIKEVVPEKKIEMRQVERKVKRYQYVPVEKQIVHYPSNVDLETAKGQSRVVLKNQGVQVKSDAEYRPINPALIYNYSDKPENSFNPIGYVDQGQSRVFSTAPTFISPTYIQGDSRAYYQPQPGMIRTQSASRLDGSRQISPRVFLGQNGIPQSYYPQGESYIKELSNINRNDVKRPFEILEQSKAGQSNYNVEQQQYQREYQQQYQQRQYEQQQQQQQQHQQQQQYQQYQQHGQYEQGPSQDNQQWQGQRS